jgi:hypothetical protein
VSSTGHKNVYKNSKDCGKPYYVARKINKKSVWFGAFATIEDAVSYTMTLPPTNYIRHIQDDAIEKWIKQRLRGKSWSDINRSRGLGKNSRKSAPISVYGYLKRKGRLDEAKIIWDGRPTAWLDRIVSRR